MAALVCAAVLVTMPGRRSRPTATATLQRYARDTWASFVAMTDEKSGLPADVLEGDGSRSVQTSTTNIGAYLWSAVAAERLGIIAPRRARSPAPTDADHARGDGAPRARRPVLQLVRPPRRVQAHQLAADRRAAGPDPLLRRQRLARGRPADRAQRVPELAARASAIYDSMDFGFYYVPEKNRILFHYSPAKGTGPCCYDTVVSESRIADYVGIAKGELPRKAYYGRWRTFPDTCAYSFQETRPSRLRPQLRRRDRLRGQLPLRLHAADAELGRLDVRGADAGAVRARGALGAGLVADEPPDTPSTRRSTTG